MVHCKIGDGELRVLFLQPQPCIRTLKYAKALKHVLGNNVSISLAHTGHSLRTLYGYGEEYFDNVFKKRGGNLNSFISRAISETRPDIIHSHNAPDHLTIAATEVSKNIPVIHDTHEVLSVHHSGYFSGDNSQSLSRYAREEKVANERSHARIYATDGIRNYVQNRYRVNRVNDFVFVNYVSQSDVPKSAVKKFSEKDGQVHIAYVGCITSLLRDSHYYLVDIFREIACHKMHIHIHPASNLITRSNRIYGELAAMNNFIHLHRHMNRRRLLERLTRYDYGWVGLNASRNRKHLEIALPNKVIEYVACGLPVLAFAHRTIKSFIETNRVGLVGRNVGDLASQQTGIRASTLRSNVERAKKNLIIENRIGRLVQFYQRLLNPREMLPYSCAESRSAPNPETGAYPYEVTLARRVNAGKAS